MAEDLRRPFQPHPYRSVQGYPGGRVPRSLAEKWRLQPGKRLYLGKTCITGAENVGRAK